ncbi:glycosyltransferase [Lithospermum erythrorhizon]|uniref:Dolichyl-diphosphooligosaccharide--protein glycosyltransferase subunit 1 n=1 Tax=Lithospermum erythrorhizon TaxID=34254 RepID=A0AAV3S009_LITER
MNNNRLITTLFILFIATSSFSTSLAFSNLIISKLDSQIDLTSQVVRSTITLKIKNNGDDPVSEVLLPFPEQQAEKLTFLVAGSSEGKGKRKSSFSALSTKVANPEGSPPALTWYSVLLSQPLSKGDTLTLEVKTVFAHSLRPFPEKITQADAQLLVFQDSAYYLSPYPVKVQSLTVKLPDQNVESYTKIENTQLSGSEIKYGPYQNIPSFSFKPIAVHFVSNRPLAVAEELVREIEISHWGNIQVTEHYKLIHGGAQLTGEFSRLDFQARFKGVSAFRNLIATLPPRARSIYYRDEIGNISTSNLRSDSRKTLLDIEPRYPMFGGWKTSFTIGYSMPLKDFLFQAEGKRFVNITFSSPFNDIVVENLTVKVVLPEGSKDISVSVPFPVKQSQETKISHLDMVGRPVVVLEKSNVVPEHNLYFQVYYRFNSFSLLWEPLMLISGFFFLFVTCIIYMHADLTISKSSASYLAKLQWDEVQSTVQQIQNILSQCLAMHDKLEASLRDLSRTGDIKTCKAARKAADGMSKELFKEMKPLLSFLHSSPQAAGVVPKVEEVVAKERELLEKLMLKHSTVTDSYEKKLGGREIENRVASIQQKVMALRQEVDDLLDVIDEI